MLDALTQLYGDCREVLATLPAESVHLCVTSPPYYGLRAYSDDLREIGREQTPEAYIQGLVSVFREVRRVLRGDGVLVLNLGDSYAAQGGHTAAGVNSIVPKDQEHVRNFASQRVPEGAKPKDKLLIPHRVALALQADGWWLRSDIPWLKRNAMPESVTDRPSVAHEYVFLLAKGPRYWWDAEAVRVASNRGGEIVPLGAKSLSRGQAAGAGVEASGNGKADFVISPAARNYRTTDPWFASLDAEIAHHRARLAELERIRERGGLLTDEDGEALALPVNPRPYSGAHFAVFPTTLVEPFIKAACPRQACPACGAGWVRMVEREKGDTEATSRPKRTAGMDSPTSTLSYSGNGSKEWAERGPKRIDLGFRPACACPPAEPVPGVALDPFGGSGTVGQVAIAHGRRAILIELNAAYSALQDSRTDGVQVSLFDDAA